MTAAAAAAADMASFATANMATAAALEKDYEEVGIETAEGEGEEEGYGDEF